MIEFVVGLVEEHVDLGWFPIFSINSRTLALYNCFTIECGSPGIVEIHVSSILSRIHSLSVLSVWIS